MVCIFVLQELVDFILHERGGGAETGKEIPAKAIGKKRENFPSI